MTAEKDTEETELPRRIAIVNDDKDSAQVLVWELEEAGFETYVLERGEGHPYTDPHHLAERIRTVADGVICDHYLSKYDFASFTGAELAADLYDSSFPALVISQYLSSGGVSREIRKNREKLPVVFRRGDVGFSDPETAREAFEKCIRELQGLPPPERRSYRTVLRVKNKDRQDIHVVVPQWNDQKLVSIPRDKVENDVDGDVESGMRLFANVNLKAKNEEELFFSDLEIAPEPRPLDELA